MHVINIACVNIPISPGERRGERGKRGHQRISQYLMLSETPYTQRWPLSLPTMRTDLTSWSVCQPKEVKITHKNLTVL